MSVPIGTKVHVWYRVQWNAQEFQLHHFYAVQIDSSSLNAVGVADAVRDAMADFTTAGSPGRLYKEALPSNATIFAVTAQVIAPTRSVYRFTTVSVAGTEGSAANQGNTAGVLTFRTQAGGRREVCNKHIGPVPDDASLNGQPTVAWGAKISALAGALLNPLSLATGTLGLVPIINHPGTEFSVMDSASVADRLGTMRRRTLRIGI